MGRPSAMAGSPASARHEVLERGLELADERERRFRTARSFRDVEPPVLLRKVAPNGAEIDEDRT